MKKINEIIYFGKLIEKYHLISSHGGNISVKINDIILITETGSMLGQLKPENIIPVSLKIANDSSIKKASMEFVVHRAIYESCNANAIIHTHPEYSIMLSFFYDKIEPIDSEGKYSVNEIPVISAKNTIASNEVANEIKKITRNYNAAIVKSHGLFVWAENLEKAFYFTTSIEKSSKILYLNKQWIRRKN